MIFVWFRNRAISAVDDASHSYRGTRKHSSKDSFLSVLLTKMQTNTVLNDNVLVCTRRRCLQSFYQIAHQISSTYDINGDVTWLQLYYSLLVTFSLKEASDRVCREQIIKMSWNPYRICLCGEKIFTAKTGDTSAYIISLTVLWRYIAYISRKGLNVWSLHAVRFLLDVSLLLNTVWNIVLTLSVGDVQPDRLRRARIFEKETQQWKIIKPHQEWDDGEVHCHCYQSILFQILCDYCWNT